ELKPDLLAKLGNSLGADSSVITKVAGAAGPAILGLLAKTGSTSDGANELHRLLTDRFDPSSLRHVARGDAQGVQPLMSKGNGLLQTLSAGKADEIGRSIGTHTGTEPSIASKVVNFVSGMSGGIVSRQIKSEKLSPSGLQQILSSQKDSLLSAVPGGL